MFSRIATVGLLATLVVALIGGSAYILVRSDDTVVAQGEGNDNRGNVTAASNNGSSGGGTQGGNGYRGGQAIQQAEPRGRGSAGSEQVGKGTRGNELPAKEGGDHPIDAWTTIEGVVIALLDDELTVETANSELTVHLGPEWYWEREGIAVETGDQVEVTGFYEDGTFKLAELENLASDQTVVLRDETGRPLWAGRGGQGQSGQGQGRKRLG